MGLSKLQRRRLVKLIGPRYKNKDQFELVSEAFDNFEDNLMKVMEMARELYWEALRAPTKSEI